MISDARGGHVSPGIYTEEKDVTYSVKSLGITSLGLVGETLYGPAFEPIEIKDWSEFVDYFGGTSPEKFKGTGYPKYELPYVAKSYLEESKKLNVVRVLGLSGYLAGPAYVLTASGDNTTYTAGVIRSKMTYEYAENPCEEVDDTPVEIVSAMCICAYTPAVFDSVCRAIGDGTVLPDPDKFAIAVDVKDGIAGYNKHYQYNVSLNPHASDYIYKVIDKDAPIYIEAIYESSINGKPITKINSLEYATTKVKRYFRVKDDGIKDDKVLVKIVESNEEILGATNLTSSTSGDGAIIYNAIAALSGCSDEECVFGASLDETQAFSAMDSSLKNVCIEFQNEDIHYFGDFKEHYRYAQTPWLVSEAYATFSNVDSSSTIAIKKLFRIATISDGDAANTQIKVTIQNIDPKEGTFDVIVRDFNDSDANPVVLEKFSKCTMAEGESSYVAYKIGTIDGGFESKSKYISVEMFSDEDMAGSVPCGFLGYPMYKYGDNEMLEVKYNTEYNPDVKSKKQYFGLSNNVIDTDLLKYKGVYCYDNMDCMTNGFHLDSIFAPSHSGTVYVDGVSGYTFSCVSDKFNGKKVTGDQYEPRILNAPYMEKSFYKDKNLRKFTVCFYGGFDGWDINREERTNTNNFKASKYDVNGSQLFGRETDARLNLPATAITTDYYAYLAGYRAFANPQDVDINLFATPGIDWYNHTLLTQDAIDMIEDKEDGRGGDALYVMNAPTGFTADELAGEFDSTDIDTSFACTYGPCIMYYDASNKKYLTLPVTKDVIRNMAATDNNSYPWFAPAGIERGDVKCVKAEFKTTLAQEDELYENRINPVKSFAQDGVKIWGNKTAYKKESPLNRINVRRLMIRVQKLVKDAAKSLIFEQYDDTLEKQFKGLVEPILAEVKANRGIYDYRVITECTEETRDQHILPAKILIKPTPALEYISISFVVYPESVSFDAE